MLTICWFAAQVGLNWWFVLRWAGWFKGWLEEWMAEANVILCRSEQRMVLKTFYGGWIHQG